MDPWHSSPSSAEFAPPPMAFRVPLSRPRATYVLLGVNVAVFLAMTVFGAVVGLGLSGSQDTRVLLFFGALQSRLVAQGEYFRLVTSMFLHIGLLHLAFNSYALYLLGQDVESLYGTRRFLVIYLLSGVGGSLVSYVLGSARVSAGASGAIFGLIGAAIAYFYVHRRTYGQFGRMRLQSLLTLAGINLVLGFTVPGINNLAHLGGLLFGLALGYILAPQYRVPTAFNVAADGSILLEDRITVAARLPQLLGVLAVMGVLVAAGTARWG
ncbi:MAG: rhomboid family intramembrane serine protease [Caldilineales bacterium]|nr:rhomboid family intramembrane serine protease [Caldilineales bacterium]MDW8318940.1 rhomboid family intramembrane serine protease [Anaerolineae bacterium]